MKQSRKEFLKCTTLAGIGITGVGSLSGCTSKNQPDNFGSEQVPENRDYKQQFNMSGYAAPALDQVRIGVIGTGSRGRSTTGRFARIEGVEIKALCDLREEAIQRTLDNFNEIDNPINPDIYAGSEDIWKELCDRDDIDLVIINTPWHLHAPQAVYAMEKGKHVATETPAAQTIEDCWKLVETSEKTWKHCFQMTNACYSFFEMVTLNMARSGFFGEVMHGEGAYIHELTDRLFDPQQYQGMWRLHENANRNGNLYPHHGLGTIAQIMDINHGDNMDFMVSVSSNDFMLNERAKELAESDPNFKQYIGKPYRGNMNTSIIKTKRGKDHHASA